MSIRYTFQDYWNATQAGDGYLDAKRVEAYSRERSHLRLLPPAHQSLNREQARKERFHDRAEALLVLVPAGVIAAVLAGLHFWGPVLGWLTK